MRSTVPIVPRQAVPGVRFHEPPKSVDSSTSIGHSCLVVGEHAATAMKSVPAFSTICSVLPATSSRDHVVPPSRDTKRPAPYTKTSPTASTAMASLPVPRLLQLTRCTCTGRWNVAPPFRVFATEIQQGLGL
jgi:hypothetical protein